MECLETHPSKKNSKKNFVDQFTNLTLSADERFLSYLCSVPFLSGGEKVSIMPNNSRLDRVYARLLQDHPYGWTLYKKFTTDELYPGCCGYFDSDGDWHFIADLTAGKDLVTSRGWTAPDDEIVRSRHEKSSSLIWGPKSPDP